METWVIFCLISCLKCSLPQRILLDSFDVSCLTGCVGLIMRVFEPALEKCVRLSLCQIQAKFSHLEKSAQRKAAAGAGAWMRFTTEYFSILSIDLFPWLNEAQYPLRVYSSREQTVGCAQHFGFFKKTMSGLNEGSPRKADNKLRDLSTIVVQASAQVRVSLCVLRSVVRPV